MSSNRFSSFVKLSCEALPRMPLVHTCEAFEFRDIAAESELKPAPCEVFKEPLLYFFYGRPAYRPSKDRRPVSHAAFLPISIVVDATTVSSPTRVAPFDTGAFLAGLYADYVHPKMSVKDFLLEPTVDMPARIVGKFFGSNAAYFYGRPQHMGLPPFEFEVNSYYNLIRGEATSDADDRRSCVEIQTNQAIQLDAKQVLLVVLPAIFLDVPEVRETIIGKWRSEVRTYNYIHCNPREYMAKLYDEVHAYLEEEGFLLAGSSSHQGAAT